MAHWTTTPQWRRFRLEMLERDGYKCRVRGPKCKKEATEVDHIIPVDDGGAIFDPANCRAACNWCNTWRAQRQKSRFGWKRSKTRITLLTATEGWEQEVDAYLAEHASVQDLVIDYRAIAKAIGDRPDEVKKLRGSLLTQLRRGDVKAPQAWITSFHPRAEAMFPHHAVVHIGPWVGPQPASTREW